MLVSDWWGVVLALLVVVAPLWLAWLLLGWSERRKIPPTRSGDRRGSGRDSPGPR